MVTMHVAAAVGTQDRDRIEPVVGENYWTPGDPDFGTASAPRFAFADPHAAGLFHAEDLSREAGDRIAVHNRGVHDVAAVVLLEDGRSYVELLPPGSEIALPEADSLTYLQAPPHR